MIRLNYKSKIFLLAAFCTLFLTLSSSVFAELDPGDPGGPPPGCATSCTIYNGYGSPSSYFHTWVNDGSVMSIIAQCSGSYPYFTYLIRAVFQIDNAHYWHLTINGDLENYGQPCGRLRWEVHYTNGFVEVLTPVSGGDTINIIGGPWGFVVDYIELDWGTSGNIMFFCAIIDYIQFYN